MVLQDENIIMAVNIFEEFDGFITASVPTSTGTARNYCGLGVQWFSSREGGRVGIKKTCLIPPYTPLLYSKTGVCTGIPIFAPKHRLWVLVGEAVLTCTPQSMF